MTNPRTLRLARIGQGVCPPTVWAFRDALCDLSDVEILAWAQDHPEFLAWSPALLADDQRLWLVPVGSESDSRADGRYEVRQASVLDAGPCWLALVGLRMGFGGTTPTRDRAHDVPAMHALPELLAAVRAGHRRMLAGWVPDHAYDGQD